MDGFWFPNGKYIKFAEVEDKNLCFQYDRFLSQTKKNYTKELKKLW